MIRAVEVRLVDEKGEMLGVMKLSDALAKAHEVELDVVEISPKANPPVCKIIDYGKFQYEEKKKERIQKKASKSYEIKGIRLSFRIGPGDLERQKLRAEKFLTEKHPVRIQLVLKGREKAHRGMAFEKMKEFVTSLADFGTEDQPPRMTGFQIIAVLKPKVGK